ncbi:MAG: class I SAM-dependent methyltransferase [Firmicutes bacterium]|jgi:ubiquinone/menaquinone biosynthesis C-methylase UbiE|nr:class I SAM-dependent methyltransferase [Bacillota bacterium]
MQAKTANILRQERFWGSRARSWDHGADNNPGLVKVVEKVISSSKLETDFTVLDLGCGSGQLAIRIAPFVKKVIAVDISQNMINLLQENAAAKGIENIETIVVPVEHLILDDASIDAVVSNYALHHLKDDDKALIVQKSFLWLRAGGQLTIGDMMFGRGMDARDRQIIGSKLALMVKRGPGGWWRICKNAFRYLLRLHERPVSVAAWKSMLQKAGFTGIEASEVVNEAAVVFGFKEQ